TEKFMAFLTPFPNTKGVTVVAPKEYLPSYIFSIEDNLYLEFLIYVKDIAKILDEKLNVSRTSLIFMGTGIDHLHAKLYPLHGPKASQTDIWADHVAYYNEYPGYVTTVEGPEASKDELNNLCELLKSGC